MPESIQGGIDTQIIIVYLIEAIAIIFATTVHEFTKALVSYRLGDELPKKDGKITLNPIKHFEPVGFLLMLFLGYGWGAPVRTSALYYKDRKKGTIITYTVPIIVNLLFGVIFFAASKFRVFISLEAFDPSGYVWFILWQFSVFNLKLAVFNLIPVYPLCANKILGVLLDSNKSIVYSQYEKIFQLVMIMLLIFPILRTALDYIVTFIMTGLGMILPGV
ncbi:MAG: site-2 protease family protein [Firmicutes bacterium]|nr:site-2 protease family protein [Bacillota bacterium]